MSKSARKIVVGLFFADELEMLRVAVQLYMPHVASIDLLQSTTTLSGRPRRVSLSHNPWQNASTPVQLHTIRTMRAREKYDGEQFDNEDWTVETETRRALGAVLRARRPGQRDCIFFPDIDELVHPSALRRACDALGDDEVVRFDLLWFHTSPWQLAMPALWRIVAMANAATLEQNDWDCGRARAANATVHKLRIETMSAEKQCHDTRVDPIGWHCSWCFRHRAQFVNKMRATSHVQYASFADNKRVVRRMMCDGWFLNQGMHGSLTECHALPGGSMTLVNACALRRLEHHRGRWRRMASVVCALLVLVAVLKKMGSARAQRLARNSQKV